MKKLTLVASSLVFALTGCASIVGHNAQTVGLNSKPPGADVTIVDETGKTVFEGKTPTTVSLNKSTGHYFGGKTYIVKLTLAGFKEDDITLNTHVNGWYIGGNILFGGLIGWFIVDPMNGGMYTLSPSQVDAGLARNGSIKVGYKHGNLNVVMIKDVPNAMRRKMIRVGTLQRQ